MKEYLKIIDFVLLTGPSRGYILEKLKENKINHKYIGNISKKRIKSTIMNLIDINLISSLREGGPKSGLLIEIKAILWKIYSFFFFSWVWCLR